MTPMRVLLIDHDDSSATLLQEELQHNGFAEVTRVGTGLEITRAVQQAAPELVLCNHHFDRPDDLLGCCAARLAAPHALIAALASSGPTARQLRHWANETGHADAVLEKPFPSGQLRARLLALVAESQATRVLQQRADRMSQLLPEGAIDVLDAEHPEEIFEAAVLFSDVRRSSEMITRTPAHDYFRVLNASLSTQGRTVRACRGAVVKYTGDGLMALFRGMGSASLALRCAQELAASPAQEALPYGIGVAQGLVLSGLVGASDDPTQRAQYDVIGATVHLAARLCALAAPAQVVTTRELARAARRPLPHARELPAVQVRGFPLPIACVAFQPQAVQEHA